MGFLGKIGVLATLLLAFSASTASAADACRGELKEIVASSPYVAAHLVPVESSRDGVQTFRHRDDSRMIVSFEARKSQSNAGHSRGTYVKALKASADTYVSKVKDQGRWAESAAFPYDPVGWLTVEETEIASVGDALVGHMELRFSSDCTVVADFVAPSSLALRTRWTDMVRALGDLRDTAAKHVVPEQWLAEDTSPVGVPAIAGGFIVPLAIMLLSYMVLSSLMRFDDPSVGVRAVIGGVAAVAAAALAIQSTAFVEGFHSLKFVDNLLLYGFTGVMAAVGCMLGYRAASFALVAASISGVALVISSLFGWTPSPVLNGSFGGLLIVMGAGGVYIWSMIENGAFRGVARR